MDHLDDGSAGEFTVCLDVGGQMRCVDSRDSDAGHGGPACSHEGSLSAGFWITVAMSAYTYERLAHSLLLSLSQMCPVNMVVNLVISSFCL